MLKSEGNQVNTHLETEFLKQMQEHPELAEAEQEHQRQVGDIEHRDSQTDMDTGEIAHAHRGSGSSTRTPLNQPALQSLPSLAKYAAKYAVKQTRTRQLDGHYNPLTPPRPAPPDSVDHWHDNAEHQRTDMTDDDDDGGCDGFRRPVCVVGMHALIRVDVAEVYSPERVTSEARENGLLQGSAVFFHARMAFCYFEPQGEGRAENRRGETAHAHHVPRVQRMLSNDVQVCTT